MLVGGRAWLLGAPTPQASEALCARCWRRRLQPPGSATSRGWYTVAVQTFFFFLARGLVRNPKPVLVGNAVGEWCRAAKMCVQSVARAPRLRRRRVDRVTGLTESSIMGGYQLLSYHCCYHVGSAGKRYRDAEALAWGHMPIAGCLSSAQQERECV
ncbi:hypothetical protein BCV70DRAFT_110356 [Testicularia cyperi]|uniref:Uncharacterized protein n=1 Tax=Testicularia cyperi TaxID=1882483 RepID=A0A317XMT9_9BASI|nr:hypothetical protein BCV70DRAFT_110356 [Testicularia cyperi]